MRPAILPLLAAAILLGPALPAGAQDVAITGMPPYAVPGFLDGQVTGVDFASHRVAVYIQIEGSGWWTKPTFASPSAPIAPDGSFSADVASGGLDDRATIYCAALILDSHDPPQAAGAARIPAGLQSLALDCQERYGRILQFAGRSWAVKEAPLPVGPGANVFSDRPEDVWVDAQGRLHLSVHLRDGQWWATEVILLDRLGFGTYAFQTESELDDLDPDLTFGAFLWDPYGDEETVPGATHREIDFEDSRWGDPADPENAQMVVQPYTLPDNLEGYSLPELSGDPSLTRFFRWWPEAVDFVALRGLHSPHAFPPGDVIHQYLYGHAPTSGRYVPGEGRESFRLNLWPNHVALGGPGPPQPSNGQPAEVIVRHFLPEPGGDALALSGCAGLVALGALRRHPASCMRR